MEAPDRAGVLRQAEETASSATVKVVVKHAMGKGEVEVEVREGATLGDVREAIMKRLGGLQKRLRLVRRAGTVTLVTLPDSDPLGEQREVLVMGADLSSLAVEASPAQATAPAAPLAPAGSAVPAVSTEPVVPAVLTAFEAPAAGGREAPSTPAEAQVPAAPAAPREPAAPVEPTAPTASAPSAAPAAPPGRAAEPAQAAPTAAPADAAAEAEDTPIDLDVAKALEILKRFRSACESRAVQLELAEKWSQGEREPAPHEVGRRPRRAFRTGGAGGVFAEVTQDVLPKMGFSGDRVGLERVYKAIQRHEDKPEISMAEQRIEQVMRVPRGSWFPQPDGHQPAGLTAGCTQQSGNGMIEVSVEHVYDRGMKWVLVPVDATGHDVKMALACLGVDQMLTHGQLALRAEGCHRPLLDHEHLGAHRAVLAVGADFTPSKGSAAAPVLTLSQTHHLLESMWCKCLERSWDFKVTPNSAAFKTLVGAEFAAACQDVVTKFGFSGDRSGFKDMFAVVIAYMGDPAVQVLTKHIEELLRVPRGSYFGIIGETELRPDEVPARPCVEKPRERQPSPESSVSSQQSGRGRSPETTPLPVEQAALPAEARPPAVEHAIAESGDLQERACEETSDVEVAVSYALKDGEFRVIVPAAATMDDVLEAVAKHEGRSKRDVGRLVQRVNSGTELLGFENTEALGSLRSLLLLEAAADTGGRAESELTRTHRLVDKILSRVQSASFRAALNSESSSNKAAFQSHRAALVTKTFAGIALEFGLSVDHYGFQQMTSSIAALRGDAAVRAKTDKIEEILHFSSGEMFSTRPKPSPVAETGKLRAPTGAAAAPGNLDAGVEERGERRVPTAAAAAPGAGVEEVRALLDRMWQVCSQTEFRQKIVDASSSTTHEFRTKRGAIFLQGFGGIVAEAGYSLSHEGFQRMFSRIALHAKDLRVARRVSDIEDSMFFEKGELLAAVLEGEDRPQRESKLVAMSALGQRGLPVPGLLAGRPGLSTSGV